MGFIKQYYNNNKGLFIIAVSVFVAGVIGGCVVACRLGDSVAETLAQQLDGYITADNESRVTFGSVFANRCEDNLRYILALLLFTSVRWFLPLAAFLPGVWGYRLGFAVSFVCGSFGGKGVALTAVSSMICYLIIIPLYILAFVMAVTYSPGNGKSRRKGDTVLLLVAMAVIYGILCLGALAEGLLVPFALGIILR